MFFDLQVHWSVQAAMLTLPFVKILNYIYRFGATHVVVFLWVTLSYFNETMPEKMLTHEWNQHGSVVKEFAKLTSLPSRLVTKYKHLSVYESQNTSNYLTNYFAWALVQRELIIFRARSHMASFVHDSFNLHLWMAQWTVRTDNDFWKCSRVHAVVCACF